MREKLGFFRKLIAKIAKRIRWWQAEKMNLYVLALMAREVILTYQELFDGDLGRANGTLKDQFADAARSYLMNYLDQLNMIMSKDLGEFEILSEVALWTILGKKFKEFFTPTKYIPADDPNNKEKIPKFLVHVPKCLMCSVIQDLDLTQYQDLNYGEIISYALGSLVELIMDSLGFNFKVVVTETKCVLRGDPHSEITYYLHEREP